MSSFVSNFDFLNGENNFATAFFSIEIKMAVLRVAVDLGHKDRIDINNYNY